jgi:hypothetical protein
LEASKDGVLFFARACEKIHEQRFVHACADAVTL